MTDQPAHTDCHSAYESCAACAWEDGHRQGIQAGREAAARDIEAERVGPGWGTTALGMRRAARIARGDQEGGGTDG